MSARAGRRLEVRTELQGAPLTLALLPLSYTVLRHLDCRRALAEVRRHVLAAAEASGEEFDAQWAQLFAELAGIGALTMSDTWQE